MKFYVRYKIRTKRGGVLNQCEIFATFLQAKFRVWCLAWNKNAFDTFIKIER